MPGHADSARRHAAAARAWLEGGAALAVSLRRHRDRLAARISRSKSHSRSTSAGPAANAARTCRSGTAEWETQRRLCEHLAMYAFGLEENGQYRRAERTARRALAVDPRHPGAIHVVAHVMEMQARFLKVSHSLPRPNRHGPKDRIFSTFSVASRVVPSRRGQSELRARDLRRADRE